MTRGQIIFVFIQMLSVFTNQLVLFFSSLVAWEKIWEMKLIFTFSRDFYQLRERMNLWHTEERYQRIGDVVVKFSPFFKMYTEYVKNFDNAIHTINTTYAKNTKFAAIMDEIHVSKIARFL